MIYTFGGQMHGTPKQRMAEKRRIREAWFKLEGVWTEEGYRAFCQSCGANLYFQNSEFSHKIPAGRGGDHEGHVQPGNGICSCRACHNWLERGPFKRQARDFLVTSPASFQNSLRVDWPEELMQSLRRYVHG
jgi:hypothetical protein